MNLDSDQLEAFSTTIRYGSFSKAAKKLFLSQSALSQRILNLESHLETTLIIRSSRELRLTAAGSELLRYCESKKSLEKNLLERISGAQTSLSGTVRLAGFSSVMRSIIMPALDELISSHNKLHVELFTREMRELEKMLQSSEVDFIVTTSQPTKKSIISHIIGHEENFLTTQKNRKKIDEKNLILLDHDEEDMTSLDFLNLNKINPQNLQRRYLDEIYSLIDGVRMGWGQAILPLHLTKDDQQLKIIRTFKPLIRPIYIQFYDRPFTGKLHQEIIDVLTKGQ